MNTYYTNEDGTKTNQVNVLNSSRTLHDVGDEDECIPAEDSEKTYPEGLILQGFYQTNFTEAPTGYPFGNILTASTDYKKGTNDPNCIPASSQFFLTTYGCEDFGGPTTYPIFYRSMTDYKGTYHSWSPWRRIAYYDEIEAVVIAVLKSKGLIT